MIQTVWNAFTIGFFVGLPVWFLVG